MRAAAAIGLLEGIAARGGSPQRALKAAGLRADDFTDPDRMLDLAKLLVLFERAAHEAGDDALGLHLGVAFDLGALGALSYAVLNAPTVGTALHNLERYATAHMQGARVELALRGREAVLHYDLNGTLDRETRRQNAEGSAAVMIPLMRRLTGADWRPHRVLFGHRGPADVSEHERLFRAPVLFGQPEDAALVFAASDLERTVPGADRGLLPIVERHLAASLPPKGEGDPWLAGLRDEISRRICDGQPTILSLAKRLGLGVRTLQRRLDERGLVFKTLVEEIRRDLALRYLGEEEPSLTEVAFLLGYSEVSAFNRAFRRWTGGTPLEHRKRALVLACPS